MNAIKTAMLMAALTAILLIIGNVLMGGRGVMIALIMAFAMNFFSYWFSDKIVLKMYRAQEVTEADAPELYSTVAGLTQAAGLPMPKIYIIPTNTPNAFATGRNPQHAVVAVTQGILSMLNRDELEGVLGHELGHVKNRDILISTIAATMAGAISSLAYFARWGAMFGGLGGRDNNRGGSPIILIVTALVAPLAAMIIQLAISRTREYKADAAGARFSGKPLALASALNKLQVMAVRQPMPASPATAHMFTVSPLSGGGFASLFSTHPPTEERIHRLEEMGHGTI
ncbi:MAG: protease HtpX [Candidatus Schekmanbacteria bacterium RBG_13_48_7]|uniref:Protease HtpX homolog n=1 Tax=Candidatus Schekmanbacteria bacterium RBG_13_48_7 TaxID=1817878 RepID=A0A1F7RSH2_9BACT|nr:MAG: protease HtpX [Candidatus Schekmanbacteria bacterium RBG_13_48_7]